MLISIVDVFHNIFRIEQDYNVMRQKTDRVYAQLLFTEQYPNLSLPA